MAYNYWSHSASLFLGLNTCQCSNYSLTGGTNVLKDISIRGGSKSFHMPFLTEKVTLCISSTENGTPYPQKGYCSLTFHLNETLKIVKSIVGSVPGGNMKGLLNT